MDVELEEAPALTDDQPKDGLTLEQDPDEIVGKALNAGDEEPKEDDLPTEIELGGERYTHESLQELVTLGKDAKETKAEATRRFQEAADLRKGLEPWMQLQNAWNQGPEAQRKIVAELQALAGQTADVGDVKPPKWDDMTENEQFLYKQNLELQKTIQSFQASIGSTLGEVKDFVGQTKAEKQAISDAAEIKQLHGIEVTPAQVQEMRANGIADPVKAMAYLKPQFSKTFAKGHEEGAKPKPATPGATRENVFDDSKCTGDEALHFILKGMKPASRVK